MSSPTLEVTIYSWVSCWPPPSIITPLDKCKENQAFNSIWSLPSLKDSNYPLDWQQDQVGLQLHKSQTTSPVKKGMNNSTTSLEILNGFLQVKHSGIKGGNSDNKLDNSSNYFDYIV